MANDGFNTEMDDSDGTFTLINLPPDKPTINGPTSGIPEVDYDYTVVTTDPNSDLLYYYVVDWGDASIENWTGFYESGEEVIISHNWSKRGTYTIRVKAKDMHGAESDERTFKVTIPRNKATVNSLFQWFLERFPLLERLLSLIRVI